MTEDWLNLSGTFEPPLIALFQTLGDVAEDLAIPLLVVGMTIRDLVLYYGHDTPIERESADSDFAVEVPDWPSFLSLRDALLDSGFRATRIEQRILSPENILLEIIPFVEIENDQANIVWSDDGEVQSNVVGFQEVFDTAEIVRIQEDPGVDIRVATPAGMAVLTLLAWLDRDADTRLQDAGNLLDLLGSYGKIPAVCDWLYEDKQLLEDYDWDITLASAWLLGEDTGNIVSEQSFELIAALFNGSYEVLSSDDLAAEMSDPELGDFAYNRELLNAFAEGFLDTTDFE